ncbi:MAG: kinase/pyrophosphorylase [Proteobacteria bacterium]|nr:kinase/pyrophosphorylase [Pseudomonadota bacterium]MCH9758734.1 kinase/pyrophosphorylase [Pseudomonadota bacterium]
MLTHYVYYLSDSTGITVESLGRSVLAQFSGINFLEKTMSFVDSKKRAIAAAEEISASAKAHPERRPIVFYTFADESFASIIEQSGALTMDCLDTFIRPLAKELGREPSHATGTRLDEKRARDYQRRIDALNYTMNHDDGISMHRYAEADIILIGVSRSGKTPTSLYLALHYGVFAANYPLVDEDLTNTRLPEKLTAYSDKLYGLTIAPQRLTQIRGERRPNSRYAELDKCRQEVGTALRLFDENNIRYLDVTRQSVEELASKILYDAKLPRYL